MTETASASAPTAPVDAQESTSLLGRLIYVLASPFIFLKEVVTHPIWAFKTFIFNPALFFSALGAKIVLVMVYAAILDFDKYRSAVSVAIGQILVYSFTGFATRVSLSAGAIVYMFIERDLLGAIPFVVATTFWISDKLGLDLDVRVAEIFVKVFSAIMEQNGDALQRVMILVLAHADKIFAIVQNRIVQMVYNAVATATKVCHLPVLNPPQRACSRARLVPDLTRFHYIAVADVASLGRSRLAAGLPRFRRPGLLPSPQTAQSCPER